MPESIATRLAKVPDSMTVKEIRPLLNAVLADLTALRTAVTAITAKLDADAGVTDTNYAATCNPAALTTTS
ncbi:MAG: hypothetical protein AB7N65_14205 [Vicinamibacterales bacterium]